MDWTAMWQAAESAIKEGDEAAEVRAIDALQEAIRSGESMPFDDAVFGFSLLREHCRFDCLVQFGDLCGFDSEWPAIRTRAIQGLIELRQLDRAIAELEKTRAFVIDRVAALPEDGASIDDDMRRLELLQDLDEVRGLLGRIYKQRCVDGVAKGRDPETRASDARKSMHHYLEGYRASPGANLWHGINYVAVAEYARRNLGVEPPDEPPAEVARRILRNIRSREVRGFMTIWDHATRGEAELALGHLPPARESFARYLDDREIRRFKYGSTLRQLRELWELNDEHELIQLFQSRVNRPSGGEDLEARHTDAPYDLISKNPQASLRAKSVARLGAEEDVGVGSGFLIDGTLISETLARLPVLLTCAHVCPDTVEKVFVTFFDPQIPGRHVKAGYSKILWSSPKEELDATLLLIGASPTLVDPLPIAAQPPKEGEKAYVIAHPHGGAKLASLRQNNVSEAGDVRFYYPSATDEGSSGGPVFNDQWEVTGIHRAGPKSKQLNEGTRIDVVLAALCDYYTAAHGPKQSQ